MDRCTEELAFYDCSVECETEIRCLTIGDPGHVIHSADVRTGTGEYVHVTWQHYVAGYVPGIEKANVSNQAQRKVNPTSGRRGEKA